MKKLLSVPISKLLLVILGLVVIYVTIVTLLSSKTIDIRTQPEVIEDYYIPEVLKCEHTKYENMEDGVTHIYNENGEVLIDKQGRYEDILQYIDEKDELVDTETTKEVDTALGNDYSCIKVRKYNSDRNKVTTVSYMYNNMSYGLVIPNCKDNSYVVDSMSTLAKTK